MLSDLVDFLVEVDKLKKTYRFSTLPIEVHDSSADHSWKLALMIFSLANELKLNIDVEHSIKLAIVHDIPEYVTGEIDSYLVHSGKVKKGDKNNLETKTVDYLAEKFGKVGEEIRDLFIEFNEGKTRCAKYVIASDKLEALTHLLTVGQYNKNWSYTATYADKVVRDFPELKPVLYDIKKRLKVECKKWGGKWDDSWNEI